MACQFWNFLLLRPLPRRKGEAHEETESTRITHPTAFPPSLPSLPPSHCRNPGQQPHLRRLGTRPEKATRRRRGKKETMEREREIEAKMQRWEEEEESASEAANAVALHVILRRLTVIREPLIDSQVIFLE